MSFLTFQYRSVAMKVNIIVLAEAAYACIKSDHFVMDVRLSPGKSAIDSMNESAKDMRAKADRLIESAKRIESAASILRIEALTV